MLDGLVKSPKRRFSVIPAKAGIQFFQIVINYLDSGFHRSDDFLRVHHACCFVGEGVNFGWREKLSGKKEDSFLKFTDRQ
jgi:hypothetical protein